MKNQNFVSIIIINYNGKKYLEKCLKFLETIEYENYEIILVDNNSTDDSVEFVKNSYPSIIIIKLDNNYGFAEPNNIGAKNAKGNFLLFLNNDTEVTPNFVTELVKAAKTDKQIAICQSLLLKPNGEIDSSGDFLDTLGRAYSSKIKPKSIKEILSARGASMLVKREIFENLGGFDKEYFASFEDVDLGWRCWIAGYKVIVVPSSIVYHSGGQTIKELSSVMSFHGVKNTLLLRLVNFEFSYAIKSTLMLFFVSFMRKLFGISVVKDPEQGPPLPSFKIISRGIFWIFKNSRYIIAKRKKINSNRVNSTKDLINKGLVTKYSF